MQTDIDIASIYMHELWYNHALNNIEERIFCHEKEIKLEIYGLEIYGFLSLYQDHVFSGREKNLYSYSQF